MFRKLIGIIYYFRRLFVVLKVKLNVNIISLGYFLGGLRFNKLIIIFTFNIISF